MSYTIEGVLTEVFNTQQITEKFCKRELVIEKTENNGSRPFTETIKFQLTNDRCDLIDPYAPGQEIKVHFNIKGREYSKEDRTSYFVNLEAWRIEGISNGAPIDHEPPYVPDVEPIQGPEDDLPF